MIMTKFITLIVLLNNIVFQINPSHNISDKKLGSKMFENSIKLFSSENKVEINEILEFIKKEVKNISDDELSEVLKNNSELANNEKVKMIQIYVILKDSIEKKLTRSDDYLKILDLIKKGNKLKIETIKKLPKGTLAAYNEVSNSLLITKINIKNAVSRSLIIHEMTHVADDISPIDSPLKEDKDNKLFRYESEMNAYISESEYRDKYKSSIEETEFYNLTTLQTDGDDYIKFKKTDSTKAETQLKRLKNEIIRIYTRNLGRMTKTEYDYKSQLRNPDGL